MDLLIELYEQLGVAIAAIEENESLRMDRDEWKHKYIELLNESIKHTHEVSANILLLTLKGK